MYIYVRMCTEHVCICVNKFFLQQLGNIATTGENARRYFHAIAGDRDHQGELFGIENTFQLRTGERSVTEDIFQVGYYDNTKFMACHNMIICV